MSNARVGMGIARVSRALVGVPPTRSHVRPTHRWVDIPCAGCHRRDADGCDQDGRAPFSSIKSFRLLPWVPIFKHRIPKPRRAPAIAGPIHDKEDTPTW